MDNELKEKNIPCKILNKKWYWTKYDDGSGHLNSPNGKIYMIYDLQTNEYKITENSKYEFFPLDYYYIDGEKIEKFKPFEYMEKEMIRFLDLQENKKAYKN